MTREELIRRELAEHDRDVRWGKWLMIAALILVLGFVAYADAYAAYAPQYTVSLYKSTTKSKDFTAATEQAAWDACYAAGAALQPTTTSKVTCKTPIMSLAVIPDPPPLVAHLSWHWTAEIPAPPNLIGYRIQYGQAFDGTVCQVSGLTNSISIGNLVAYDLTQDLKPGTWCFAIRSVSPDGEGDLSSAVVKTL